MSAIGTPTSSRRTDQPRAGRAHLALLLLAFSAGAADAFAFLALGGIFTANMTGNLVLIGMFSRPQFGTTLVGASVALVFFVGVLYAAFRVTVGANDSPSGTSGRVVARLLVPSLIAQFVASAIWIVVPNTTGLALHLVVIALSSGSLALQTVAAKKLSDISGITTTYVTGTLTTTMQELAERKSAGQGLRVLSVVALPIGAIAGTATLLLASAAGPVLPLVVAAIATILLWSARAR